MTDVAWRPAVTVVIPTLNAADTLDEVLTAIEGQRHVSSVEILVVDSSSEDRTEHIVLEHPGVRFVRIERADFGHGRTRQYAAEIATGEVVAFLTQDATPESPRWLCNLVAALEEPDVAGVFGRQIPRPGCVPIIKYDIERVFAEPPELFYSDANSAARRAVLLGPVPYQDVNFSEDFRFAADAAAAGLRTVYAPSAAVLHSNDIRLGEYAARMRAEVGGHALAGIPLPRYSWFGAMARALRGAVLEEGRIIVDREYGIGATLKWLVLNPLYHFARWQGIYQGARDII